MSEEEKLSNALKAYIEEFGVENVRLQIPRTWEAFNSKQGDFLRRAEYHDENVVCLRAGSYNYTVNAACLFPTN